MKALYIYFFLISTVSHYECYAQSTQIVILNPSTATAEDSVEIIYDPSLNTTSSSILGTNTPLSTAATSIYMHSGVVTVSNGTKWSNIIGNWGKDDGIGKMRKITGTNKWRIKILPRAYYNVPEGTNIFRLAMVFRNAEGTAEGKGNLGTFTGGQVLANGDIYVNLTINNYVTITSPTSSIIFQTGIDSVRFEGVAISSSGAVPSQISLFISQDGGAFQNVRVRTNTNTITFRKYVSSSAKFTVRIEAVYAGNIVVVGIQSFSINVKPVTPILPLPAGVKKGINYHPQDPTRATLVLHTPKKTNQARAKKFVYVVGDFSNWETNNTFFMNQTADSSYFWIELRNLIPGKEYVFQYWVDGNIKIGDPYADKIVDTYNDIQTTDTLFRSSRIPQEYEIASVLQTNQTAFAWESTENTRTKPRKQDLIIYELLIRDFSPEHSFQSVIDSLPYLKRLGINAIQLMPIMEFEGNESWGYNPSYYFAPDKYYGSKNDLKLLIQEAHKQGMVVILDMVLNHAFGQCALSRLYWDEANNRPSAENPWFNTFAPHAYGLGSDFNHESTYTQDFVDEVNKYWLQEFHFDGYRFDLTKGFTNTSSSGSNDNANYDQSRINILKRMANKIWEHSPGAYVILEHFADASEENVLASEGMLLWSNATYTYGDILLGSTSGNTNFVQNNTRVNYMESHDEERLMYKAKASSAGNGSYRVNDLNIGLNRVKTLATLFYTVPGPKMLWQFQELGYDISINYNGRVGNKPLVWGNNSLQYYQNAERQKLYKTIAALFKLINENRTAFTEGYFSSTTTGDFRTISINHENLSVAIVGNVYLQETTGNIPFARTGTWYDYFTRETKTVNSLNGNSITLAPGEFHIYVNKQTVTFPEPGLVDVFKRQVITLSPAKLIPEDSVTIYFDESRSVTPCGLLPINSQYAKDIYLHSGILTQNITPTTNTTWEHDDEWVNIREGSRGLMTNLGNGIWRTKLGPSLKEYYNVGGDTVIYKIAMIFRNSEVYGPPNNDTPEARGIPGDTIGGTGLVPLIRPGDTNSRCNPSDACTARCGNIWMNITPPDASVLIQSPQSQVFLTHSDSIDVSVKTSTRASQINLFLNNTLVKSVKVDSAINYKYFIPATTSASKVSLLIRAEARFGPKTITSTNTITVTITPPDTVRALPPNVVEGINYNSTDPTKATLVLYAPKKSSAHIVGDFSNWSKRTEYKMRQTKDSNYFWIELTGLQPQREYVFQYWLDDNIKTGDTYTQKVVDPQNDNSSFDSLFIKSQIPPQYGIASVLQTQQASFTWEATEQTWSKPSKQNLILYQLLLRDFLHTHSFKELTDSLVYLKRLGVNALLLLPVAEFEGNESWGYKTTYHFALDKYYGKKNDLKKLIQEAHKQGMAVFIDMNLENVHRESPLAKLFWDFQTQKPTSHNPWINRNTPHPTENDIYDMNHRSPHTKRFIEKLTAYWITEFHLDGIRLPFAKGFTNQSSTSETIDNRDTSRINILKTIANDIWKHSPNTSILLSDFSENEQQELAHAGFLLSKNTSSAYNELMIGKTTINSTQLYDSTQLTQIESPTTERLLVTAREQGISQNTALLKNKSLTAFFHTIPGPKMLWQFQELGYDTSAYYNGLEGKKPLPWQNNNGLGYAQREDRKKLSKIHTVLIQLMKQYKKNPSNHTLTMSTTGDVRSIYRASDSLSISLIANFSLTSKRDTIRFAKNGTWHNYFSHDTLQVKQLKRTIVLSAGEFQLYVSKRVPFPELGLTKTPTFPNASNDNLSNDSVSNIVTVTPKIFTPDSTITITFNASAADPDGTDGLTNATKIYFHSGIAIQNQQDTVWKYTVGNWGKDDSIGIMRRVPNENTKWQITLNPKKYYTQVLPTDTWHRIGMVFRNEDGSLKGKGKAAKDIFINFSTASTTSPINPIDINPPQPINPLTTLEVKNTHIKIFPNPTDDYITIQYDKTQKVSSLKVYDITGKSYELGIRNYELGLRVDLKTLPKGEYIIIIYGEKGEVLKAEKVIKE